MSGAKGNDNDQWGLVSADGTRATAGRPPANSLPNGDGTAPIVDQEGRLWIREGLSPINPSAGLQRFDNNGAFNQLQAAIVITVAAPSPATLIRVFGFKSGPNVEYLQLYDDTDLTPAGVPFAQFPIVQNGSFSLDFGVTGRPLVNGLTMFLATVTTAATAAPATAWFNAEWVQ